VIAGPRRAAATACPGAAAKSSASAPWPSATARATQGRLRMTGPFPARCPARSRGRQTVPRPGRAAA